ncbi:MAG: transporter substrate-binding domain-containing protein [Thermotaleaceae bacterium]
MKKILVFIITLALCVAALTGCQKEPDKSTVVDDTSDKPLAGKHLKVAMSANYKYFETVTIDKNGKEVYEGLDIDILDKISEDLGFTYEIMNMPFASLIGALQANQADFVISGMSYTEERAQSIDFSDKYATAKVGVLKKADSEIASVADLKGKKVACSAGTNFENIIKKIEGAELVTFDGQAAVTQELMMGRVDAAITGGTGCKKIAEENEGLSFFIIDSAEVDLGSLSTYNIGFPKGSDLVPVFNEQIAKMNEDGTLKELIIKWLGEDYID